MTRAIDHGTNPSTLAILISTAIEAERQATAYIPYHDLDRRDIELAAEAIEATQAALAELRMMGVTEEALKAFAQII